VDFREHFEQELQKDFELLKQYEDERCNENDPGLRSKWNNKIDLIKGQIINRQKELQSLHQPTSNPSANQSFIEELGFGIKLEMIYIPGGTFLMGAPKSEVDSEDYERPQHYVTVKPFNMGKYTITQEQWEKVVYSCPTINDWLDPHPSYFKGDKLPVERVSWYDAVEFCTRLAQRTGRQYRLPSEAEWEYACRAGSVKPFSCGDTITTDVVNYNGDYTYGHAPKGKYLKTTTAAGTFPPNVFGLYDMHGNVMEWCADVWHDSYDGAPNDGSAWINNNQYRLLRGGSCHESPEWCRSATRNRNTPVIRYSHVSFRVVCGGAART
jgi:formylglycine-generating enzyme required for sulfatase activity